MTVSHVQLPGDPQQIGPYRLIRRLGAGGQGVVHLGRDEAGTLVAVKVLREDIAADPDTRARFAREVAMAQRVASFCTAQFLGADLWANPPYIVTEYVEGPSLQEDVSRNGPRNGPSLHRLAVGTATALTAIHEAGLVHRDFKPGNVLLGPDGPQVIDFGIARALDGTSTTSSQVIGTPAYMAPEQIKGEPIGASADVFAWGAVITYAAIGRSPFAAQTTHAVLYRVIDGAPDVDGVPEPLRSLVVQCLAKDPAERPAMQDVLLRLLGSRSTPEHSGPVTPPPPVREARPQEEPAAPGATPDVVREQDEDTSAPAVTEEPTRTTSSPEKRARRVRLRPVAIAVAGVLLACGLATGAFLYWKASHRQTVAVELVQLDGAWKGALLRKEAGTLPVTMRFQAGGKMSVEYPRLGCKGDLKLTSRSGSIYRLHEVTDDCGSGDFKVRIRGDNLEVSYISAAGDRAARGTLRPVNG
ncbi:serine/threonine-protein kinase [Sphaerisporangium fuscum]|uniref:serine/threonine-protein kinase n=1 Tax=Sphaerisporangium fuscum TaxID=2835868 RepID=UPI001BDC35FB|nr:serine/threonine-protein kinase [Sphaerisporangium fuscum]